MPMRKSLQFICVESYKLNYIGDVFVSLLQGHELLSLLLNITWYLCDVHCLKRDRKDSKQKETKQRDSFQLHCVCNSETKTFWCFCVCYLHPIKQRVWRTHDHLKQEQLWSEFAVYLAASDTLDYNRERR